MKSAPSRMELSVVIPVFNEADSLTVLLPELRQKLDAASHLSPYEVLLIDDGSTDHLMSVVAGFEAWRPLRVISLQRNLGQTAALALGFKASVGRVVVAMDGDAQNDPSDIVRLVEELERSGADCTSGWRRTRVGDSRLRVAVSRAANGILRRASGVQVNDSGCTLKAYRGSSVRELPLYGDLHRLIPFQIQLEGGLVNELEVNHRARLAGKSNYSLTRFFRVAQDIVVAFFLRRFMYRPMHLLGTVGFGSLIAGAIGVALAVSLRLGGVYDFVETPILLASSVLFIGGLNMLGIGLLSELVTRFAFRLGMPQLPLATRGQDSGIGKSSRGITK